MGVSGSAWVAILGMALVTYGLRAGGLWLMGRVTPSPWIDAWLRHIPGAVMVAIVAPAVAARGPAEIVATLATVLVMARIGNVALAMVVGVGLVVVLRGFV